MIAALGLVTILLFAVAQGAAIFATAFLGLRILRADHRLARVPAMTISYAAWIAFTITGYGLLGGEPGKLFRVEIRPASAVPYEMPGKANLRLGRGDVVVVESCGGGGYGAASTRHADSSDYDNLDIGNSGNTGTL